MPDFDVDSIPQWKAVLEAVRQIECVTVPDSPAPASPAPARAAPDEAEPDEEDWLAWEAAEEEDPAPLVAHL